MLVGSEVVFQAGAKRSKYRFFMLLLLRILFGNQLALIFICYRIEIVSKIFLSDKLALTDVASESTLVAHIVGLML